MKLIKYVIDIDNTICEETKPYKECLPRNTFIYNINKLYEQGHKIILFTARRKSDRKVTMKWLRENKVKYHKLILGKPSGDKYVDDKNISIGEFYNE